MIFSPYDKWHAAFVDILKSSKRGTQRRLAEATNKAPEYINAIYKGRRNASQDLQDQLARALDYTYEEMLKMGSELLGEEKEPFPNYNEIMKLPILERAWAIMRTAAKHHGLVGHLSSFGDSKRSGNPKFFDRFLAGEQTEEELYEDLLKVFEGVVGRIRQSMKEQGLE